MRVRSLVTGRKHSRLRGRGLDFDELKHYRPGDDIRALDWRVSRRRGEPYVRVYTEERDRPVWLIVDQRGSLFFGSQHQMKSVAAAKTAASLAWQVLASGDRVGAVILGDDGAQAFTPKRAETALIRWLSALASANQTLAETSNAATKVTMAEALAMVDRYSHHDALIVVISDFSDWGDDCIAWVRKLHRHNDVIALEVSDPLERDLNLADKLIVSDGRHQLEIQGDQDAMLANFRQSYDQHINRIETELQRDHIPLLRLDSAVNAQVLLHRDGLSQVMAQG